MIKSLLSVILCLLMLSNCVYAFCQKPDCFTEFSSPATETHPEIKFSHVSTRQLKSLSHFKEFEKCLISCCILFGDNVHKDSSLVVTSVYVACISLYGGERSILVFEKNLGEPPTGWSEKTRNKFIKRIATELTRRYKKMVITTSPQRDMIDHFDAILSFPLQQ